MNEASVSDYKDIKQLSVHPSSENPYVELGKIDCVNLLSFAYQIASGMVNLLQLPCSHTVYCSCCRNISQVWELFIVTLPVVIFWLERESPSKYLTLACLDFSQQMMFMLRAVEDVNHGNGWQLSLSLRGSLPQLQMCGHMVLCCGR